MSHTIYVQGRAAAVGFAAEELARVLTAATGGEYRLTTRAPRAAAGKAAAPAFHLRVLKGPPLPGGLGADDDAFAIVPSEGGYLLAGANPRSVLFAVYRYLWELGCRWLRPGRENEVIPRLAGPFPTAPLHLAERAGNKFRTFCIEGGCSFEHVRDLIDWGARFGMNGYFVQFHLGTCFWQRWYEHQENPLVKGEPVTPARAEELVNATIAEVQRRGLRLERMGHGWTGRALGCVAETWEAKGLALTDAQRAIVAELNGKRELFHGQPLNTNLCYSTATLRAQVAADVVAYARAHPEVDLLHLWLADGSNNHCECAACRARRPADWYVTLLNDVDGGLRRARLKTRIVFLIYVDLLWPPETARLAHPERFVLMFAPITRSFQHAFDEAAAHHGPLPPYERNKLQFPKDVGVNLAFLRAWQEQFGGDAFDFDYHLIWATYYDLNHWTLAAVLHRDVKHLAAMGLHGFNSCQVQRNSFPHNLAMETMARTLWAPQLGFDELAAESFRAAFGGAADGARVAGFFRQMSALWAPFFEPVHLPTIDPARIDAGLANLPQMRTAVEELRPLVAARQDAAPAAVQRSWVYLRHWLELLDLLLPAFDSYLRRAPDCAARFDAVAAELWRREPELHPALDVNMAVRVLKWRAHEAAHPGPAK